MNSTIIWILIKRPKSSDFLKWLGKFKSFGDRLDYEKKLIFVIKLVIGISFKKIEVLIRNNKEKKIWNLVHLYINYEKKAEFTFHFSPRTLNMNNFILKDFAIEN